MSYTRWFYRTRREWARQAASRVLPQALELTGARTLIDVGCGTGCWLSATEGLGLERVVGVDGPWVRRQDLEIPADRFRAVDLTGEWEAGRFDLAMSLEVAEHLPAESADRFVAKLCSLAPIVLFSAAIPGQGGQHHVNEQWPGYWIEKFEGQGFELFDILRPRLWKDGEIPYWYRQNMMLFVGPAAPVEARARLEELRAAASYNGAALVHPEHAERALQYPGLMPLARALPFALVRTLAEIPGQVRAFARPGVVATGLVAILAAGFGIRSVLAGRAEEALRTQIIAAFQDHRGSEAAELVYIHGGDTEMGECLSGHATRVATGDAEGIVAHLLDKEEDLYLVEKENARDFERIDSRDRVHRVAELGRFVLYRETAGG